MKHLATLRTTLLTCILFVACAPALAQQEHDHGHAPAAALTLDNGKPWATDEPLRTGMVRIRDAATPLIGQAPPKPASPAQGQALAEAIRDNVGYMVRHCKLAPKADATLHVLLGELLGGADALEKGQGGAEPLHRIAKALEEYPHYFDHPSWQAPAEHAH